MRTRLGPVLLIPFLGLLFFAELLLHPSQTLYSDYSDLLTLHLPSKHFLVRSWHEHGEIPRWCPYNFAGMPFVHDPQVSAFYPLHLPLYLIPEDQLGAALSWLIVVHVIVAGWCMYAYARYRGLNNTGAFIAALGYMFAGKWLLHVLAGGHYNMAPLAWLPLVLLWLEQAIRKTSIVYASWAGAAFGLIVLGAYPYITLYSGLFVAIWTFGVALEDAGLLSSGEIAVSSAAPSPRVSHSSSLPLWGEPIPSLPPCGGGLGWGGPPTGTRTRRLRACLATWAGMGCWTAIVGVALGAVQLLPAFEASKEASRSAGVSVTAQMLMDGIRSIVGLVGPPLTNEPNCWENRAGLGLLWLALAVAAPAVGTGRVRFQAGVFLFLVAFALGGGMAFQWLPGFRLFRLPSRMLLIAALPAALLAGTTVQALVAEESDTGTLRGHCRRILLKIAGVVVVLAAVFALTLGTQRPDIQVVFHPYWLTLLITLPAALWLMGGRRGQRLRVSVALASTAWIVVLLIDVCSLTLSWVEVRREHEIYKPSPCVSYLRDHALERGRVLDINPVLSESAPNETPLWPGLPAVHEIEPVRGFNPIDILRYKEFLQFITDDDQPLRPLDQMFTGPILGTFPIRNHNLADLLGIRYLLQPADLPLDATVQTAKPERSWMRVFSDPHPTSFNFIPAAASGNDCGLQPLPPYQVYRNQAAAPRAFIVSEAATLPDDRSTVLSTLKATDFTRQVLLEGFHRTTTHHQPPRAAQAVQTSGFRAATIREYSPNRVVIETGGAGGYLVLADIWFPGWECLVDHRPTPIYRANYLFRAVELGDESQLVEFVFSAPSYEWGKFTSALTLVGLLVLSLMAVAVQTRATASVSRAREECYAGAC
jgi:hypothetical protein